MTVADQLRKAGYKVEARHRMLSVSLTNRAVSRNEVAAALEVLDVEPAGLRQVGGAVDITVVRDAERAAMYAEALGLSTGNTAPAGAR
jgi:hypothetical protein